MIHRSVGVPQLLGTYGSLQLLAHDNRKQCGEIGFAGVNYSAKLCLECGSRTAKGCQANRFQSSKLLRQIRPAEFCDVFPEYRGSAAGICQYKAEDLQDHAKEDVVRLHEGSVSVCVRSEASS